MNSAIVVLKHFFSGLEESFTCESIDCAKVYFVTYKINLTNQLKLLRIIQTVPCYVKRIMSQIYNMSQMSRK